MYSVDVCRACLTPEKLVSSVYEITEESGNVSIAEMLEVTTGIKVSFSHPVRLILYFPQFTFQIVDADWYPDKICENCLSAAYHFHAFKLKCEQSHAILTEQFQMLSAAGSMESPPQLVPAASELIETSPDAELETRPGVAIACGEFIIQEIPQEPSTPLSVLDYLDPGTQKTFKRTKNNAKRKIISNSHQTICGLCGIIFKDEFTQMKHNKDVHGEESPFRCNQCPAVFSTKCDLLRHMKIHDFKCSVCFHRFESQSELITHSIESHQEDSLLRCKYCPLKFKRRSQLTVHIFEHTGKVKYQCESCHIPLWSRKHQIEHMRIHTGEKPFTCEVCQKKFRFKRVLIKHIRVVHTQTD